MLLCTFVSQVIFAQNNTPTVHCNTSEVNALYFKNNVAAHNEYKNYNLTSKGSTFTNESPTGSYEIPVVFHVYGTSFNGSGVNDALIEQALRDLNMDFQGLNDDFQTVNSSFSSIKSSLNISFRLAKKDPNGNQTTGIVYYPERSGYGNASSSNTQIMADAWDNYSYMNVYIQNDLYNDNVTNNSGVAWYPISSMSDNNLARVVYNGAYLATNTNKEFASTLTHEFGHWLNLIHTFEGGCNGTDEVDDTPRENGQHNLGCAAGTNCDGELVNNENYMGYNGSVGCYKMFTAGQVNRMMAALQHPARVTLWQTQNLIDTGLQIPPSENIAPTITLDAPLENTSFEEGSSFTLTTSIEDMNGRDDIDNVTFYIDGNPVNTVNFAPYEHTYEDLPVGDHILRATVQDKGGLSNSEEITISVSPKIYFPEIKWISSNTTYTQNNIQFAAGEKVRRIEIRPHIQTHAIIVKGPDGFEQEYTTILEETIIIENISKGTWRIEIPSLNKVISKTFN